jgi:hypothetical protein
MVEELRQVLDVLGEKGQLSEEARRRSAAILLAELEQQEWDALIRSPRSKRFLATPIAEAEAEEACTDGSLAD